MFDDYDDLFFKFIMAVVLVIGAMWAVYFYNESNNDDFINNHERVQVGTVQAISTTDSFSEGNVTTLRMEDGKTVTLSGKINPWQPGQAVSQPKAKEGDSADEVKALAKVWCVADKCLSQN